MTGAHYHEQLADVISELEIGEVNTFDVMQRIYKIDDLGEDMPEIVTRIMEETGVSVPSHVVEKVVRATFITAYKNMVRAMNEQLCCKNETNL